MLPGRSGLGQTVLAQHAADQGDEHAEHAAEHQTDGEDQGFLGFDRVGIELGSLLQPIDAFRLQAVLDTHGLEVAIQIIDSQLCGIGEVGIQIVLGCLGRGAVAVSVMRSGCCLCRPRLRLTADS